MCNFRVGQKVVCVDDRPTPLGFAPPFEAGNVLTIIAITEGFSHHGRDFGLIFHEVPCVAPYDDGYSVKRFRPVVERKTDISIFKAMLNPSKQTLVAYGHDG